MQGNTPDPGRSHRPFRAVSLRLWLALVLGLSVIVPAAGISSYGIIPWHTDFIPFYAVGTLVRDGRSGEAYDDRVLAGAVTEIVGEPIVGLHWLYPPGMLLVTWPLAYLPPVPAYLVWLGLGLVGVGFVTWRLAPRTAMPLLLPLCPAVTYCAITGQVSLLATALAGGGFLMLHRRPTLAGILFGILTLKIQIALLLPFCLLAGKHYRTLACMLATAVLLQLLGIALAGPESALSFLKASSGDLEYVALHPKLLARIPTVYSLLIGISGNQVLALTVQILVCIGVIGAVSFIWRRTDDIIARSLGWAAGALLAVPYLFDYDLAIFLLPLAAIACHASQRGIGWIDAGVMTLLWSASFVMKYLAMLVGFQLGPFGAAALLAYAAWLAARPSNKRHDLILERATAPG
jgi:glycosyl transferase family 87